jgi:hypothetical protein
MKVFSKITICVAWLTAATLAPTQAQQPPTAVFLESADSNPLADRTYFYEVQLHGDAHAENVIITFDNAFGPDGAAAVQLSQSIHCENRQITTARYAAYGVDGALLHEAASIPAQVETTIGTDAVRQRLISSCTLPPKPMPGVAVDPPPEPAFDRVFNGRVTSPAEAIALVTARAAARRSAAALTPTGRWGTVTGDALTGFALIDYVPGQTDGTHMSYLVTPGHYETGWSYGRARYTMDCAGGTASVEYLALYNDANEAISISGPSRRAPISLMTARRALAAACSSRQPHGRTFATLPNALGQLRALAPHH